MGINWEPFLAAPWFIQLHAAAAVIGVPLALIQFAAPKGTLPHQTIGLVWMLLMAAVTISSAFIIAPPVTGASYVDRLSFIHIFTITTATGLFGGAYYLTRRDRIMFRRHWRPFLAIFIGGLLIAGYFAFAIEGRVMNEMFFG
jgi:uncharacterized membrane protein